MPRLLRDLLFLSFALFIVGVIVAVNLDRGNRFLSLLHRIPHFDKIGHFILMGILAFLTLISFVPKMKGTTKRSATVITVILLVIIALEEASQHFLVSRTCSLTDYLFSAAGVMTAALLSRKLIRSKTTD